MLITRRSLFGLLAAPAIIRVADLMPVRALSMPAAAFEYEDVTPILTQYGNLVIYMEREMLRLAKPCMVLERLRLPRSLMEPRGDTIKFRRPLLFSKAEA